MKLLLATVVALGLIACDKPSDSKKRSPNSSDKTKTGSPAKLNPLGDDADAIFDEVVLLMTELKDAAVANKSSCDKLAKAMHARLDALTPRLMRAKAASTKLEKKWANKDMEERTKIISRMPQFKKIAAVSDTTNQILDKCRSTPEVARFETRLMKLVGH